MLKYFRLLENPFSFSPSPRYFYLSTSHRGILNKVDYVIDYKQGLSVIFGDLGMGKSMLAKVLEDRYVANPQHKVFYITNPNYKTEMHMAKALAAEMGIGPKRSQFEQMKSIKALLTDLFSNEITPILIIDEAQNLVGQQFEILREFNNYETDSEKLLQVVLCGQLELRTKLNMKKALLSRVVTSSTLDPLSPIETEEMIRFRIRVAEGDPAIFPDESIIKIYDFSLGRPRDIMRLCGLALKIAHLSQSKTVTPEIATRAHEEGRT